MRAGRTVVIVATAMAVAAAGTAVWVGTSSAAVSPTTASAATPTTEVQSFAPLTAAAATSSVATSPLTAPLTAAPLPVGLQQAADSVPAAGWFHLTNAVVPPGASVVRYRNVDRAIQTGMASHMPGPLDLWFRALGAPGSAITVQLDALDGFGQVLADLGTITVITGHDMLPLPEGSGGGRRMVVGSDQQQVWLVEADGSVSDTFPMSGRRIPTASGADQSGVFRVYSKSKHLRYCEDGVCGTAEHMVRYQRTAKASVGTHSLPTEYGQPVQSVYDLGWPISHGCTRLEASKAAEVYLWADFGTIVIVM